jgi:hypothetical protein
MAKKSRDERLRRQARERRVARVRRRGRFTLVGALLSGVLALLLPFGVVQEWSQERPFEQAVACDSVTAPLPGPIPDCLLSAYGTVVTLHQTTGKGARQFVNLRSLGTLTGDVAFSDPGFYNGLTLNQTVTATFWRGQVVELTAGGTTVRTDANPTGTAAGVLTFDLLATLGALWLGYLSFWYLRRTERSAAIPAPPALVLPARVAAIAVVPGLALAIYLGTEARLHATVGSLLLIPALLAAVLALAASTLLFPWMRRPGEVRFKR